MSVHFSLKMLRELIKSIYDSKMEMSFSISKIVMCQFKLQFNLYFYEAEAVINSVFSSSEQKQDMNKNFIVKKDFFMSNQNNLVIVK